MKSLRQQIADVILHYQNSQATGLKDIESQLQIFTDNCIFMSFAASELAGKAGIHSYRNKDELRESLKEYNDHIQNPNNVDIEYFDTIIDEENMRASFNLLFQVTTDPSQPKEFFNTIQFYLNKDLKVFKAYNWQGDAGEVDLYDLLNKKA